jgi:putative acetyltransferase
MAEIVVEVTAPDRPDVVSLINELDDYLIRLYPPASNHLLGVEALMPPKVKFVLARSQSEAVGCGAIRLEDGYAEIKRVYVKPAWRGRGVGYRLLSKLEELARQSGHTMARLETGVRQSEAQKLYERNGYVRRGPFGEYTHDPLSLFYEKELLTG